MAHFVYILASRPNGALYVGRTERLGERVAQHRLGLSGHTRRYRIDRLVWFEEHGDFETSLRRERRLKKWDHAWKNALVAERNPEWEDLSHLLGG